MSQTRWGIIGPGSIAHNFATGLEAADGVLLAIASTSEKRLSSFGQRFDVDPSKRYRDYDALLHDPDVDAVYVSVPHPFHAALSVKAINAGKAVLCEKPAGLTRAEVLSVTDLARRQGVFFMEGYMYRCHPQLSRVVDLIQQGAIGDITHIRSSFGFQAPFNTTSRLYDRSLAGGAILDVGGYPVSFSRLIAGAAIGESFAEPVTTVALGNLASTGVDNNAFALLKFESGIVAECSAAINQALDNHAVVTGTTGSMTLNQPWDPGKQAGPSTTTLVINRSGIETTETIECPLQLFAYEAQYANAAIQSGMTEAQSPAMSFADSVGNAVVLDAWRQAVGVELEPDVPKTNKALYGLIPPSAPRIPAITLEGLQRPVSRLIMGCDNQTTLAEGAVVWDAWMEAGGTTFDTAWIYGSGLHEKAFGQWIKSRDVADDITVIVKGAHTPECYPSTIATQLEQSLKRLGLDRAPIYLLHRDNESVPVEEFVDALTVLQRSGKIGIFGGSNWSPERIRAANRYAANTGAEPFRILNNNLSLAVMEKPVWPGCVTCNDPDTLAWLTESQTVHFSWSSQARGYFLSEGDRNRLPINTSPERCFGSERNVERRKRAEALGIQYGVSANNIAAAWVLSQPFPSFALTGPRSVDEIVTTLPALSVSLTEEEVVVLNAEG